VNGRVCFGGDRSEGEPIDLFGSRCVALDVLWQEPVTGPMRLIRSLLVRRLLTGDMKKAACRIQDESIQRIEISPNPILVVVDHGHG
jgi:hypothetical protein